METARARRRDHANRVLRLAWRAADCRAGRAARGSHRRRDFTINAMAASLKPADFGRLVDPHDGRSDLEARVVRVLHNLSFIDDPTRILRGIRYEARYGLPFDEHTARLARGCIDMGLVGDLSSVRLRDELVQLLEDSGAPSGIERLGELGVDERFILVSRATRRRRRCSSGRELCGPSFMSRFPYGDSAWRCLRANDVGRGLRLARSSQGSSPRRRPDRRGRLPSRRGSSNGFERSTSIRRRSSLSRIRSPRMLRSSRWPAKSSRRFATTSRACAPCDSRSAARISSPWACRSRHRSARFSRSCDDGS